MVESMALTCDRTRENLGTTDAMIIQVRHRLMATAKALSVTGIIPPGAENPEVYRVRSASLILPKSANWVESASDSLMALTGAPVAVA